MLRRIAGCFLAIVLICASWAAWEVYRLRANPAIVPWPQFQSNWFRRHRAKVAEAKAGAGHVELVLVGDSITGELQNDYPEPYRRFPPIWNEFYVPRHALNLGFGGDSTGNVLWRLRHGEVDGLTPVNVVLLIGTNNFLSNRWRPDGDSSDETIAGVLTVADELHRRIPAAHLLLVSILPTGFPGDRNQRIAAVNAGLRRAVASRPYASYLDVARLFYDGERVRLDLFYDQVAWRGVPAVHPTGTGQRIIAEAVTGALYGRAAPAN